MFKFQSPQWGSNSKDCAHNGLSLKDCFSPRNGEVILKDFIAALNKDKTSFQSPQWGSNSKGVNFYSSFGSFSFQSPQWGSNSKVTDKEIKEIEEEVFSPRNGEVILKDFY